MKIVWAEPAEQDLDTIVEHIAKDNLQAALDMDDLLRDCADRLVSFPKKGKPGRVPGTREFVAHRNYILVYVVTSDAIQIVAVLHAARLWPPAKQERVFFQVGKIRERSPSVVSSGSTEGKSSDHEAYRRRSSPQKQSPDTIPATLRAFHAFMTI